MDTTPTKIDKVMWGIRIWGALIALIAIAGFIYSLFHPVTSGPTPPGPWPDITQQAPVPKQ